MGRVLHLRDALAERRAVGGRGQGGALAEGRGHSIPAGRWTQTAAPTPPAAATAQGLVEEAILCALLILLSFWFSKIKFKAAAKKKS